MKLTVAIIVQDIFLNKSGAKTSSIQNPIPLTAALYGT
jgi:hypothetical protein